MIWSECKEIWEDGLREYIMQLWNILDFSMLSIFVASFTARFMAFLQASRAQQYVDLYVVSSDLCNASLPAEVAYFTYGKIVLHCTGKGGKLRFSCRFVLKMFSKILFSEEPLASVGPPDHL